MTKIAVAMSGGVDSSTVFMMLRAAGHDVFGVTMRHLPKEMARERVGSCCAPSALAAAGRLTRAHDAAHHVFGLEEEFAAAVMKPSAKSYAIGVTPNPCVWCNERVKFDLLFRRAMALGADVFATGHYARIKEGRLCRAVDRARDQSYFLYRVHPDVLARTSFPLGGLTKEEVREKARAFGIEMADKEDSMDVCFAPAGDFSDAFRRHAPEAMESGDVVDERGAVVGTHAGIGRVTIGQRRGLGIPTGGRVYVRAIDPDSRRVTIGDRPVTTEVRLEDCTWVDDLTDPLRATARIRSQHAGTDVVVERRGNSARAVFGEPQAGVTPGQSLVCYQGDEVLGGGVMVADSSSI